MTDRIVLDFVSPEGSQATHVRSALIGSSIETLRTIQLYDRFVSMLPYQYHEQVLYTLAPTWHPIDVAIAFYQTYEELGMSDEELERVSAATTERLMSSLLATVLRGARATGATPWAPLGQLDRIWPRIIKGGSIKVVEKGPKEALLEIRGLPMLRGRYFRSGIHRLLRTGGSMFTRTLYLREISTASREAYVALASWV